MNKYKSHYLLGITIIIIYSIMLFFFLPISYSPRTNCLISINLMCMVLWLLQWIGYEKVICFTDMFYINIISVITGGAVILITVMNSIFMFVENIESKVIIGLTLLIIVAVSCIVGLIISRNKEN